RWNKTIVVRKRIPFYFNYKEKDLGLTNPDLEGFYYLQLRDNDSSEFKKEYHIPLRDSVWDFPTYKKDKGKKSIFDWIKK
ncbi:MAG: hypothetical protein V5A64_07030, partial [Candidatus Thermoplasmatota archaeon]